MMQIAEGVWRTERGTVHAGEGNVGRGSLARGQRMKVRVTDQTSGKKVVAVSAEVPGKMLALVVGSQHTVVVKNVLPSGTTVAFKDDHRFFGMILPSQSKGLTKGATIQVVFGGTSHRNRTLLFKPMA